MMRRATVTRVMALAACAALFAGCSAIEGSGPPISSTTSPTHPTSPPTSTTLPRVPLSSTSLGPKGWVPVAFGDAQISVPPSWTVDLDVACPSGADIVMLGGDNGFCAEGVLASPSVLLSPYSAPGTVHHSVTWINGSKAIRTGTSFAVRALGVDISFTPRVNDKMLRSLTRSPRAVVSEPGPAPRVPSSWKRIRADGVSIAVPGGWPVSRTKTVASWSEPCQVAYTFTTAVDSVTLSTASLRAPAYSCPALLPGTPATLPKLGLVVNAGRYAPVVIWPQRCERRSDLKVCASTSEYEESGSVLTATVRDHGLARAPFTLYLGLAGTGLTDRTIVDSIQPG